MPNRRDFILQTAMAGGVMAAQTPRLSSATQAPPRASKPLRILILGGTGFIGPYHVRIAVERGHQVSVFNRGRRSESLHLPAAVEQLIGDRTGDLGSIKGREWDAVIDLSTYVPAWVRSLGAALQGRVKHYTFISTVMTYARSAAPVDESSAVLEYTDARDPYLVTSPEGWGQYGSFKVLCEREAEKQFPGKIFVVRPTVIAGPEDSHLNFWFRRMQRGGEILAPGDPLAPVQCIDVRDLAQWIIQGVERGETGTYNAVGPAGSLGMAETLGAIRSHFSTPMRLTWVPTPWLIQ